MKIQRTPRMLRRPLAFLGLAAAGVFLLGSCATTDTLDEAKLRRDRMRAAFADAPQKCLNADRIQNWKILDRYSMIVWAPSKRSPHYVEFATPCDGLRFTISVGFDSGRDGRLCGHGGDSVILPREGLTNRCMISRIYALPPAGMETVVTEYGLGEEEETIKPLPEREGEETGGEKEKQEDGD